MNRVVSTKVNSRDANLQDTHHHTTRTYTILGISLWFLGALTAGWNGLFSQSDSPPFIFGMFIMLPIAAWSTIYALSERLRAFANNIPLYLLTIAHVWRFVGLGFVIAVFANKLPPQFGYPEGIGDVVAAAFAIPVAAALNHAKPIRKYFVVWNVFGLVDLISAITVGVLYSQGTFGILRTGLSTELMTSFPVHLVPTFFVPLFILLHLLALMRRQEVGNGGRWSDDK